MPAEDHRKVGQPPHSSGDHQDIRDHCFAEGKIPDCKIISNKGFTEEEALQLEEYMGMELMRLKNMAASVRVMDAFLGKEKRGL